MTDKASVQLTCQTCGAPLVEGAHGQYMVIDHDCASKLQVAAIEMTDELAASRRKCVALTKALSEAREALAAFDPACGSATGSAEALCAERNHYRRRAAEMHVRTQEAEAALNRAMRAGLDECERLRPYEAAFHVAMDRAERAESGYEDLRRAAPKTDAEREETTRDLLSRVGMLSYTNAHLIPAWRGCLAALGLRGEGCADVLVATAIAEIQRLRAIEDATAAYVDACRVVAGLPRDEESEIHQLFTGKINLESIERAADTYIAAEQSRRAAFDALASLLPKRARP